MPPPTRLEVKQLIIEVVQAHEVRPEDIDDSAPLAENALLGLDSVDFLEITVALRTRYGVRVDDANLARTVLRSVDSILEFIARSEHDLRQ